MFVNMSVESCRCSYVSVVDIIMMCYTLGDHIYDLKPLKYLDYFLTNHVPYNERCCPTP